jgi:hypothetical protein
MLKQSKQADDPLALKILKRLQILANLGWYCRRLVAGCSSMKHVPRAQRIHNRRQTLDTIKFLSLWFSFAFATLHNCTFLSNRCRTVANPTFSLLFKCPREGCTLSSALQYYHMSISLANLSMTQHSSTKDESAVLSRWLEGHTEKR